MRSARLALAALVVGAFLLPMRGLTFDRVQTPLERTKEYELSTHVVGGQVKALHMLDADGNRASSGPRFSLDLTVTAVHKMKEKLAKGATLTVRGWRDGKQKQTFVPKEKDEVLAFLKRKADGQYEPLVPTGFKMSGVAAIGSPAPGRGKESAKPKK